VVLLFQERRPAYSDMLVLPRTMAPAFLSCLTTVLSSGTLAPTKAYDPAVVSILSAVAILSLIRIGMPWSGPYMVPLALAASGSLARARASGLISRTALKTSLTSRIRAM
jgi:hypothetical protein